MLGLARECLFGYFFSTSELLSAFRIAFMLPNLARRLFGEGALSSATVPVLTETLHTSGEDASRRFVGTLLTVLVVMLAMIVLAVEVVIAVWRMIQDDLALQFAAILMPYMGLICTVAIAGAVLNVRRHFATPAATPMILNIGIIISVIGGALLAGLTGTRLMTAVCVGVLVAGAIQLVATGVALRAISFFPIFGWRWRDPQVRAVGSLMVPMILGLSAMQINALADYLIAYAFIKVEGARVGPAVLGYAQYLYQLPLGVFGIAVATAIFPMLSRAATKEDRSNLADILGRGIRLSLFIALPASVGLMFVATPLVATLYQRGAFDATDTQRVAGTLFFYSVGLVAYFIQHILVRTFYAMRESRTPARVAMVMVGVNLVMNLALVFVLQERGLALATAVCAAIQVIWLAIRLNRELPQIDWPALGRSVTRMLAATGIMGMALTFVPRWRILADWIGTGPAGRLAVLVVVGIAVYALASRVLGVGELNALLHRERSPVADPDA